MIYTSDEAFLLTVRAKIHEKNWLSFLMPTEYEIAGEGGVLYGLNINPDCWIIDQIR